MEVRIVAFATASDVVGKEPLTVTLDEGGRLSDLARLLEARFPTLETLWPRLAVAIDGKLAQGDPMLVDGAEVALLPPVSGGIGRRPRTALVDGPIVIQEAIDAVAGASRGALVVFAGTARDHHRGRAVRQLVYSAYRPMALERLERIAAELETDQDDLRVAIIHRLGEVPIGEASVVIAAASPHREAAYRASREALERLKREVPIWKREHYADGETAWREEEPLTLASS